MLLVLLLLSTAVASVRDAVRDWPQAIGGQKAATASEFANGIAGGIALVGLGARKRWARPVLWTWAALLTATAGLAAKYWGDAPLGAALLGALTTALLCGFAIRLAIEPSRRPADEGRA